MMNTDNTSDYPCGEDAAESAAEADNSGAEAVSAPGAAPGKVLSAEAIRALEEAEARRKAAPPAELPLEWDGRGGEEPTRYGDWERRGLATDF
jgi:hypothetical protein